NSLKLVEVQATGTAIVGNYSTDGGTTWKNFAIPGNLTDPTTNAAFTTDTNPTVAIDRAENVYIAYVETNATASAAGALVFQRYTFTTLTAPTAVAAERNTVIQRWVGADPVQNPVVAVDNNLTSYTDGTETQTDTMATLVTPAGDPNPNGVGKA